LLSTPREIFFFTLHSIHCSSHEMYLALHEKSSSSSSTQFPAALIKCTLLSTRNLLLHAPFNALQLPWNVPCCLLHEKSSSSSSTQFPAAPMKCTLLSTRNLLLEAPLNSLQLPWNVPCSPRVILFFKLHSIPCSSYEMYLALNEKSSSSSSTQFPAAPMKCTLLSASNLLLQAPLNSLQLPWNVPCSPREIFFFKLHSIHCSSHEMYLALHEKSSSRSIQFPAPSHNACKLRDMTDTLFRRTPCELLRDAAPVCV